jgi:hypothetical protein
LAVKIAATASGRERVGAEAVDGLGGEGDQAAFAQELAARAMSAGLVASRWSVVGKVMIHRSESPKRERTATAKDLDAEFAKFAQSTPC